VRQSAAAGLSLLAASLIAVPGSAAAQNRFAVCPGFTPNWNVPYDGRFTFVRIQYTTGFGGGSGYGRRGRRMGGWSHDYPTAECHFSKLLTNLTTIKAHLDGSIITTLDDPDLFRFPIAYFSEPGEWNPTESEVLALRKYFQKGGFAIFDDFDGPDIMNLDRQLQRVMPGVRLFLLDPNQKIFDSFYRVKTLDFHHPMSPGLKSTFYAVYEDNDPAKRMLAILNNDNDVGDYWEWSDTGRYGIDPANEAYKLGINYIVYVLSR
jgi:hypothetical protein